MKVWMLVLLLSPSAFAVDFKYIKPTPEFEAYLNGARMKSSAQGITGTMASAKLPQNLRRSLLGAPEGLLQSKSIIDEEESLLYEEIRQYMEVAHSELGANQVSQINTWNQQFNLGSENYSGFSWQKPFGVVSVHADRQVMRNLFAQNWLVHDTFSFEIQATTFLEKLSEARLLNLSAAEIGAFAGITFKRTHTYYHYANSYAEGLRSDFSKLFLQFTRFSLEGIARMEDGEIMKREDQWTVRAGGLIATPPLYNISLSGGILAEHDYLNLVSVQSDRSKPLSDERFRLSLKTQKKTTAGVALELQLEFFELLKVSLLKYDLTYEYASSDEVTLGMTDAQFDQVARTAPLQEELRATVRGQGRVKFLEPFVIRLDETGSSSFASSGSILFLGKVKKSKTEKVRVIKDETVKVFIRDYSLSAKVVQNFFSRLFSVVVYQILKLPVGTKNAALFNRQMTLEYDTTHPQAGDPEVMRIDASEQFSFVLTQSYEAARTDRWYHKKFKDDALWFIRSFTPLTADYLTNVRQNLLKGPILIESNLRVEKAGFEYLLNRTVDNVFVELVEVCGSARVDDWAHADIREKLLRSYLTGSEACVASLGKKYLQFVQDYQAHHLKPSIAAFRNFLGDYFKRAQNLTALVNLFGEGNVFVNGRLQAKTILGNDFSTVFSSGQFRGLGVIDNFKRASGSRAPASIVSE